MAKQKNIWKFNDEEWKAHIDNKDLFEKVKKKFDLVIDLQNSKRSNSYNFFLKRPTSPPGQLKVPKISFL